MSGPADRPTPIVVGITGATGAVFGVRLLERLREFDVETHLVVTAWGTRTLQLETSLTLQELGALADVVYRPNDQAAPISSGSFRTGGMVVAPCSAKTLAAVATGYSQDLVSRAADVTMKEGRPLVLLVRESPLSAIHLENMLKLSRLGVRIVPPVPAFYTHPTTLDEMVDHVVTRALDQLGLHSDKTPRWGGERAPGRPASEPGDDGGQLR